MSLLFKRVSRGLASSRCLARSNTVVRSHTFRALSTSPNNNDDTHTHFGFTSVPKAEKAGKVASIFSSVATNYDLMNDFMSLGIHRLWKDYLVNDLLSLPATLHAKSSSSAVTYAHLDVAGGTGDISFRIFDLLKTHVPSLPDFTPGGTPPATVTVCDINPDMLRVGEQRAIAQFGVDAVEMMSDRENGATPPAKPIRFYEGNAECLPFEDSSFDCYTIAFGLRNVTNPTAAVADAFRVLKPGGRMVILEFSHLTNPVMQSFYDAYSFNIIPPMGAMVAGDEGSYRYLVESIRKWDTQEQLKERMMGEGFRGVKYQNINFGIVAIHEGYKVE